MNFSRSWSNFKEPQQMKINFFSKQHTRRIYTIKLTYVALNGTGQHTNIWPWKHICKVKIPYTVASFTWIVVKKACLTHDNLRRRECSCAQDVIYMEGFRKYWNLCLCMKEIEWVMPKATGEHFKNVGTTWDGRQKKWWNFFSGGR